MRRQSSPQEEESEAGRVYEVHARSRVLCRGSWASADGRASADHSARVAKGTCGRPAAGLEARQDAAADDIRPAIIRALAMSLPVKTLYADPTEIKDINAAAKMIATALKIDGGGLGGSASGCEGRKEAVCADRQETRPRNRPEIQQGARSVGRKKADLPNFTGLHWRDDQKRSYPYKTLAAQVVGFSNAADDGKAGVELSQDDVLHGPIIRKLQERDRSGLRL